MSSNYGDLYEFNIMKSLEKFMRADTAFMTKYPVVFEDTTFDPSAMTKWISINWVDFGKSMFSRNIFHARCFSRSAADRFGRVRETMIGDLRNLLEVQSGILFYDILKYPSGNTTIKFNGAPLKMSLRFENRSTLMDAEELGETSQIKGVHLVVLTYNVYVARPHVVW